MAFCSTTTDYASSKESRGSFKMSLFTFSLQTLKSRTSFKFYFVNGLF